MVTPCAHETRTRGPRGGAGWMQGRHPDNARALESCAPMPQGQQFNSIAVLPRALGAPAESRSRTAASLPTLAAPVEGGVFLLLTTGLTAVLVAGLLWALWALPIREESSATIPLSMPSLAAALWALRAPPIREESSATIPLSMPGLAAAPDAEFWQGRLLRMRVVRRPCCVWNPV